MNANGNLIYLRLSAFICDFDLFLHFLGVLGGSISSGARFA